MTTEQVWLAYREKLRAFLISRLRDPDDADDVLQEVLIKTHLNLASVKNEASIQSWLLQVANRAVMDFYRRGNRPETTDIDENLAQPVEETEKDWKTAFVDCVEPFVAALNVGEAELIRAIDLNGVPQKDYARTQGIKYSTLKSRVAKARANLKRQFDDCCNLTLNQRGVTVEFIPKTNCCD